MDCFDIENELFEFYSVVPCKNCGKNPILEQDSVMPVLHCPTFGCRLKRFGGLTYKDAINEWNAYNKEA